MSALCGWNISEVSVPQHRTARVKEKFNFTDSFFVFTVLLYRITPSSPVQRQRYSFAPGRCLFWISAQDINCYDWLSSWLSSIPSGKWFESTLNKLLPISFKLLSFHKLLEYNVKFSFVHAVKAMGKRRCRSTRHWMEVSGQLHTLAFLTLQRELTVPFVQEATWLPQTAWHLCTLYACFLGFCGDVRGVLISS